MAKKREAEPDPPLPDGLHVRPSRCWLTGEPKWRATYTVEGWPGPTYEDREPLTAARLAVEGQVKQHEQGT